MCDSLKVIDNDGDDYCQKVWSNSLNNIPKAEYFMRQTVKPHFTTKYNTTDKTCNLICNEIIQLDVSQLDWHNSGGFNKFQFNSLYSYTVTKFGVIF